MAMNADLELTARDEMESLLPFYLNGTLEGDDLTRLETWLNTDPAATAALAAAEMEFAASLEANEALRPRPDALSRFSAALEREAPTRAPRVSLLAAAFGWLRSAPPALAWTAAAAMLALVAVQTITAGYRGDDGPRVAGAGDTASNLPFALIAFKADAPVERVAAILSETGATIVDGPKPGGFFRVAIPASDGAQYDAIVKQITDSGLVDGMMPGTRP